MTTSPAQDRLLAAARPLVVRYCRARLGPGQDTWCSADDVAQDVCLAVLKALPAWPPERPFPNFVCGIARHKVAAARKAAARQQDEPVAELPDEIDSSMDPEHHALRRELGERMATLLRVLPEKQREIVVLRVVVGLSAEETAAAVGSTPGAVRVAQHRALTQLRKAVTTERGARR
ncbi:RNA polymerase sigma factor ShbA [Amycolatopsis balhimycina DSM 5908]|uniref:RNA polymerase sigma factor ShbA n=1 Tax=Amycolatopsis balhimycina DSM 5908 TaxID=1081091 RepID=A0A428WKL7_AMYBA|nr:RNA polymerase sigma factor ShbA [Amycolatopsis balhimycina]RSM43625.1 RNA polymerase sigma factor ShbA [Amycolatopsis balhimycina DSM 5908]